MYFCLKDFKGNFLLVFCLGFVVLSVWEYIVGVFLEKIFNTKYWDYSNYKYNLQGRVCLINSIFWGILGLLFIYFVHPFIESKIDLVNSTIILYADIAISIYLIGDYIVSIIKVTHIDTNLIKLEELNSKIKDKLEEIKEIGKNVNINATDNAKLILDELKIRQSKLNKKLYKNVYRLKKAFPTMKSDNFNKILELKNELKKDRRK